MTELEKLEARVIVLENVIDNLGMIIANHLPSIQEELKTLGKNWGDTLKKHDL